MKNTLRQLTTPPESVRLCRGFHYSTPQRSLPISALSIPGSISPFPLTKTQRHRLTFFPPVSLSLSHLSLSPPLPIHFSLSHSPSIFGLDFFFLSICLSFVRFIVLRYLVFFILFYFILFLVFKMATLAEHPTVAPSSTSPMPNMGACYDPDIDSFLNLDQITYSSTEPARPKAAMASQPTMPNTEFVAPDMRSASFASNGQSPLAFQAPSHQYDDHKQQTGLPPGALAHAMIFNNNTAAHPVNGMGFGAPSPGFAMNGGDMYGQVKREEPLDFNAVPTRNPSEMDLEGDNIGSVPGYYFSPNSNKSQFVDPNALGGTQEVVPAGHSTQVGRMYPGMHQQAAMAKAQQQKQHEMLRHQHQNQQQHQQQQQQFHQQQQQQQRRMEEHAQAPTPQPQPRAHRNPDPVVEERISRLLQQIRQNSGSPGDSPSPSMLPQMAKARKEEQDMDEDERLLASEEGKKLSSKERRQLRNKVSARAFRSRRKGKSFFYVQI